LGHEKIGVPVISHPYVLQRVEGCPVLFLSTSNHRKFAELEFLFACRNFQIIKIPPPTDLTEPQVEISDPDFESELVRHPLTIAAKFVERERVPFVVEDTMIFIEFFNRNYGEEPELPGYDTKRWWRQLGCEGVLNLMKDSPRRRAKYVSQIGAYLGNRQYLIGRGEVSGTIAWESRISDQAQAAVPITSPWFFHSIFVPEGTTRTLAEMGPEEFVMFDYKRRAVDQFIGKLRSTAMAFRTNLPSQLKLPLE
jgi:inosine/xanthosine triphosphate pyrophosphatase family protein